MSCGKGGEGVVCHSAASPARPLHAATVGGWEGRCLVLHRLGYQRTPEQSYLC